MTIHPTYDLTTLFLRAAAAALDALNPHPRSPDTELSLGPCYARTKLKSLFYVASDLSQHSIQLSTLSILGIQYQSLIAAIMSSKVGGGDVFITGGNIAIHEGPAPDTTSPLDTNPIPPSLVALDAMHDSKQRYPQPKCHPGTRDAVTALLKAWICDRTPSCPPICWLSGTAGVGKSAIMQDLCDDLLKFGGALRASFFFGRAQGKREDGAFLIPTLACQLAWNVWGCKQRMTRLLKKKPAILNQTLSRQGTLIKDTIDRPLLLSLLPASPITILIDGLDECKGEGVQADVVSTLVDMVSKSKRPLRFIVASRPEHHILKAFNKSSVVHLVKRVPLDDTFEPSKAIRLYLTEEFARIVRENPEFFSQGDPWPGDGIIELLVQSADGQFIFARIVINVSSAPRTNPRQQLQIILDNTRNFKAFSPLDALYTTILSAVSDQESLSGILACMIASKEPPSVGTISGVMGLTRDRILVVVLQLRSILKIEDSFSGCDGELIRIAHASFYDFLVDAKRSGTYLIPNKGHTYFVSRFLSYHLPEPHTPPISHFEYINLADDIPVHHAQHPIPCSYLLYALTRFFDTYMPAAQNLPSFRRLLPKARSAFFDLLLIALLHISHQHTQCTLDFDNPQDSQSICSGATLTRRLIDLGQWSPPPTSESPQPNTWPASGVPIIVYLPVKEATSTESIAFAAIINFISSPRLPDSPPIGFSMDRTQATVRFDTSSAKKPDDYHYSIATSALPEILDLCSNKPVVRDFLVRHSSSMSTSWNLNQSASPANLKWNQLMQVCEVLPPCREASSPVLVQCLHFPMAMGLSRVFQISWDKIRPTLYEILEGNPNPELPPPASHYCARVFLITEKGSFNCAASMATFSNSIIKVEGSAIPPAILVPEEQSSATGCIHRQARNHTEIPGRCPLL